MTTAVANAPGPSEQPKWLSVIPDEIKAALLKELNDLPPEVKPTLERATRHLNLDHLKECTTAKEVMELIKITAEAMTTDDQTTYLPAVWKIDHEHQRWVDDQGNPLGETISGVIVYFMPTRGFFIDGRKMPLCSAMGQWSQGKAADDAGEAWGKYKLTNPELPITWSGKEHDCAECPFNQFGSDPKTGVGKACKEKYRDFFAPVDEDGTFTGEGVMLNIPSTSLKGKDEFVSKLKRYKPKGQMKPEPKTTLHVIVELNLTAAEGQSQVYSKVGFKVKRLLSYKEWKDMYALRQQIAAMAAQIDISHGESYDAPASQMGPVDPEILDPEKDGPGF